jgi:DNA-binding transcriptional regulator YiaG
MSGKRIIEGMKEALAISRGELPETAYKTYIPENIDVKAIREKMGLSQSSFANRFMRSSRSSRQGVSCNFYHEPSRTNTSPRRE